jgi:ATP diphosphatase
MSAESDAPRADLERLLDLVAVLRGPGGCPWDREQGLGDVRAYLLEEAHEAAAAIDRGDWQELAGELGDLLFQVAFVACVAREAGAFDLGEVIAGSHRKMVARHPHVFGEAEARDAAAVRQAWERRKLDEGDGATAPKGPKALLAGVPASLPALLAAYRMSQKAAGVGFDWPDASAVLEKVDEELAELRGALAGGDQAAGAAVAEELGDLLFTVANLARKLEVDPEAALARANLKFRRRFARLEAELAARGRRLGEATLAELEELWAIAKAAER